RPQATRVGPAQTRGHDARRRLRLQDHLERRPRHRHLPAGTAARPVPVSRLPAHALTEETAMQPPGAGMQPRPLPGIKYVVAVASGKGGVGKPTVAANLAVALHHSGQRVGLTDADIYGPSVPTMLGLPAVDPNTTPMPVEAHGVKVVSMAFF